MSAPTDDEREKLLSLQVDTALKSALLRYEPWKVVISAAAAGGGLVVATAASMTLILYLLGKL